MRRQSLSLKDSIAAVCLSGRSSALGVTQQPCSSAENQDRLGQARVPDRFVNLTLYRAIPSSRSHYARQSAPSNFAPRKSGGSRAAVEKPEGPSTFKASASASRV